MRAEPQRARPAHARCAEPRLLAIARALRGSDVQTKLQEIAAADGLRIITWWWMRGGFATRSKEVTIPDSVKGLKLQSCGLAQKVLAGAASSSPTRTSSACVSISTRNLPPLRRAPHLHAHGDLVQGSSARCAPAEVSDAYFETSQREVEKRALAAFRKAGANVRSLMHEEYISWL